MLCLGMIHCIFGHKMLKMLSLRYTEKLLFHQSPTRHSDYSDSVVTVDNCQQHGDFTAIGSLVTVLLAVGNGDFTVTF